MSKCVKVGNKGWEKPCSCFLWFPGKSLSPSWRRPVGVVHCYIAALAMFAVASKQIFIFGSTSPLEPNISTKSKTKLFWNKFVIWSLSGKYLLFYCLFSFWSRSGCSVDWTVGCGCFLPTESFNTLRLLRAPTIITIVIIIIITSVKNQHCVVMCVPELHQYYTNDPEWLA